MNYKRFFFAVAMAVVILLGAAMPASAAVLEMTSSRSTFNDWGEETNIDFESLNLASGTYVSYYAAGLDLDGWNFTFFNNAGNELRAMFPSGSVPENFGTGHLLKGQGSITASSYLQATRLAGFADVTAFGVDLGVTTSVSGKTYSVSLNGVEVATGIAATTKTQGFTFFGVNSDTPFSQVRIYFSGSSTVSPVMDNFSYQTAPEETAEITTLLYVATGVFLIGWKRRRGSAAVQA